MTPSHALRSIILLAACAAPPAIPRLVAQAYTPPTPPLDAPCKPTKKDPCTAPASSAPPAKTLAFPFPGDTSDTVTLDPNADPNDPANKPAPAAPQPGAAPAAAGRDSSGKFPFPGDAPSSARPSSPADASSSSSSGSGADSSSAADDEDEPPVPVPASRRHLPKVEDLDAREAKDVEVSGFYFSTGDYLGAYTRGKDAVRLMPDDAEAHFALAQAAAKLGKAEEARTEYTLSLKLDIADDHAKVARAALLKLH